MPFPQQLPRLLMAVLIASGLIFSAASIGEAKGRKSRRSSAGSKQKSRYSKRGKRRPNRASQTEMVFDSTKEYPIVPDSIEVIEHGSSNYGEAAHWLKSSMTRGNQTFVPAEMSQSGRRFSLRMDSTRVAEIQAALLRRGFYSGDITGVYDDPTIDAMRRFQSNQRIAITGYPTAHALKRLELAD